MNAEGVGGKQSDSSFKREVEALQKDLLAKPKAPRASVLLKNGKVSKRAGEISGWKDCKTE